MTEQKLNVKVYFKIAWFLNKKIRKRKLETPGNTGSQQPQKRFNSLNFNFEGMQEIQRIQLIQNV